MRRFLNAPLVVGILLAILMAFCFYNAFRSDDKKAERPPVMSASGDFTPSRGERIARMSSALMITSGPESSFCAAASNFKAVKSTIRELLESKERDPITWSDLKVSEPEAKVLLRKLAFEYAKALDKAITVSPANRDKMTSCGQDKAPTEEDLRKEIGNVLAIAST